MSEGTLSFRKRGIGCWPRLASSDLDNKATMRKPNVNMKTITKTALYLQMIALLLTPAFAGPNVAQKEIPFHGTIQTTETVTSIDFPIVFDSSIGSGNATHLG